MRIAYFSPLNPIRSGISDYSEDLLPHLADLVDVDLFVDGFQPSNQELAGRFCTYSIADYPRRRWDEANATTKGISRLPNGVRALMALVVFLRGD